MSGHDASILFEADTLRLIDELERDDHPRDLLNTVSQLRSAGHPAERVHHALEQVRLRRKARAKFGDFAHSMLFTEAGLEQATRLQVAAHHAGRFEKAGIKSVADLGCGIGADSMAFAALGLQVRAIERDPLTAAVASYNLAPFDTVRVEVADVLEVNVDDEAGLWLDPARRNTSGRLNHPDDWSPSLTDTFQLIGGAPAGVKLAPGMDRGLIPDGVEAQWVSVSGDVVEVVLWWNALARPGITRSALVLTDSGGHELNAAADSPDADTGPLGAVVYEPDGAVIRARLIGSLARNLDGWMLDPTIAYISSENYIPTPFAEAFTVEKSFPFQLKRLRQEIRQREIGTLEIKKRGLDVDPAELRKSLPLAGPHSATLILTRLAGQKTAILATRISR